MKLVLKESELEKWNPTAGRMIGKSDAAKSSNAYLGTLQQMVFESRRKLIVVIIINEIFEQFQF